MRIYGPIAGVQVGAVFVSRAELSKARIHGPTVGGIWGASDGAESVVVSGGYEDDQDNGDEIVYTGHGGNDPGTGKQVADQVWERGNAGLARNCLEGRPVRLVRGAHKGSVFAPKSGYRYDGLYTVERFWEEGGKSGFKICRFLLVRDDSDLRPWVVTGEVQPPALPKRVKTTIQRIVRNTAVASRVKGFHNYTCQVCGIRLDTPGGPYAEGAHIRALGAPHNGLDVESNILCLCPNHHVLFDAGALTIKDDFSIVGHPGLLRLQAQHQIGLEYVAYHREHSATVSQREEKKKDKA